MIELKLQVEQLRSRCSALMQGASIGSAVPMAQSDEGGQTGIKRQRDETPVNPPVAQLPTNPMAAAPALPTNPANPAIPPVLPTNPAAAAASVDDDSDLQKVCLVSTLTCSSFWSAGNCHEPC